jgi:hypothetical protein
MVASLDAHPFDRRSTKLKQKAGPFQLPFLSPKERDANSPFL